MNAAAIIAGSLLTGMVEFLKSHPAMGILLASGSVFGGGYQYLARGDKTWSFLWMLCASVMSIGFAIGAFVEKMWVSSLVAVLIFTTEVWLMRRWFRKT